MFAPEAGDGLLQATEFFAKLVKLTFAVELTSSSYSMKLTDVSVLAGTLSSTPFPTVYVTVNVVFDGTCP